MRVPIFCRSRTGIAFATIYALIVGYAVFDYSFSPPTDMAELALLFITAPVSLGVAWLFSHFEILNDQNGSSLIYLFVAVGGAVNIIIVYSLGYFTGWVVRSLMSYAGSDTDDSA